MRKQQFGFPTRSDTNRAIQPQNKARSLKHWIYAEEELFYLCGKNKGVDQLCNQSHADSQVGLILHKGSNPYWHNFVNFPFHRSILRMQ